MKNIKIIEYSNIEEWDKVIGLNSEIYDKWQYVSVFYGNGDGIPYLAYLEGKNGYIYNIFMKRKINDDKCFKNIKLEEEYFDIMTPYGYGGVKIRGKIDDKEKKEFFYQFENYCKSNNIISEFIRLTPWINNYEIYSNQDYDIIRNSTTIYIKLENEEQIWNDFESKCRNKIKKAINNNLIVKSGFDSKRMKEFMNIYYDTMKRDSANDYYFFKDSFFKCIENNLKNNAKIFTVYLQKRPISSTIIIYSGQNAHYHLSGTLSEYMNLGANNLLLYEVSKYMCKMGFKKLHLGGGYGGDNSSLLTFKKSFNKNGNLDFYIGKKIFDDVKYKKLVNIRKEISDISDKEKSFFPVYRS